MDDPSAWANLGQGAPEVDDDIEGSFPRPQSIDVSMAGREYGPTAGIKVWQLIRDTRSCPPVSALPFMVLLLNMR